MFVRLIQSLWRNSEGSVLVEATVVTPVLFVLFFGLYEFSWYFNRQQLVETGVRDAARYLGAASSNPCSRATLVTNAKNLAATGIIGGGGSSRVTGWSAGNVSVSCDPPIDNSASTYYCPSTPGNCYVVNVQTSFPDPSLGFFGFLGFGIPNISASHTERAIQSASN